MIAIVPVDRISGYDAPGLRSGSVESARVYSELRICLRGIVRKTLCSFGSRQLLVGTS